MVFDKKVLSIVKKIPRGKVTTYGEIARTLKTSPRAVGQALKRNRVPGVVPCHRVVCSDGSIGGYSQGIEKKIKILRREGVVIKRQNILNFEEIFFALEKNK